MWFRFLNANLEEHQGSSADSKSIIHLGVNNTEKSEERVDTYLSIVDANW